MPTIRNDLYFHSAALVMLIGGLIRTKIIASEFGVQDSGEFGQLATTLSVFSTIGILGLWVPANRDFAGSTAQAHESRRAIMLVVLMASIFSTIIFACVSEMGRTSIGLPRSINALWAASLLTSMVGQMVATIWMRANEKRVDSLISAFLATALSVGTAVLAAAAKSESLLLCSFLVAAAVPVLYVLARAEVWAIGNAAMPTPGALLQIIREGATGLMIVLSRVSVTFTARLWTVALFGTVVNGEIQPGFTFAIVVTQFTAVALGQLSASFRDSEKYRARLISSIILVFVLCAAAALSTQIWVPVLFDPSFLELWPVIAGLALVEASRFIAAASVNCLLVERFARLAVLSALSGLGASMLSMWLLLPALGTGALPIVFWTGCLAEFMVAARKLANRAGGQVVALSLAILILTGVVVIVSGIVTTTTF